jgi:predicted enzyme related to lactoylglutathione lyase
MTDQGNFVWYELMTSDKRAAEAFYGALMGWTTADLGQTTVDYSIISTGGSRIGGMMNLPEDARKAGARPGWLGYIGVKNADDCAEAVEAKGGRVCHGPGDIPGYGRFAVLSDPQGAAFCIIAPSAEYAGSSSNVYRRGVPGFGGWHELFTDNPDEAFDFYSSLFGWEKDQAFDMGECGVYQLFSIDRVQTGGIMKRPPQTPVSFWNYYFNVGSVDDASDRVTKTGGKVAMGPHQVPDGSWIVQGFDPQGAMISLNSLRR